MALSRRTKCQGSFLRRNSSTASHRWKQKADIRFVPGGRCCTLSFPGAISQGWAGKIPFPS
jgi:hypothetical protein